MVGSIVRVLDGVPVLLGATVIVGAGMTVGNVLVPVVVKEVPPSCRADDRALHRRPGHGRFDRRRADRTLRNPVGMAASVGVWTPGCGRRSRGGSRFLGHQPIVPPSKPRHQEATSPWRSPVGWALAAFFGAQALCFYAVTAWLPTILVDEAGLTPAGAGGGASLFQVLGIAGTLAVPAVIHRRPHQGWLAVMAAAAFVALFAGLLLWPRAWPLWVAMGGLAQGASISLGLTLIVLRAHRADVARRLSGMVQLVGYLTGAVGPVLINWLYGRTDAWDVPLLTLLGVALALAILGQLAGADQSVDPDPGRRVVS